MKAPRGRSRGPYSSTPPRTASSASADSRSDSGATAAYETPPPVALHRAPHDQHPQQGRPRWANQAPPAVPFAELHYPPPAPRMGRAPTPPCNTTGATSVVPAPAVAPAAGTLAAGSRGESPRIPRSPYRLSGRSSSLTSTGSGPATPPALPPTASTVVLCAGSPAADEDPLAKETRRASAGDGGEDGPLLPETAPESVDANPRRRRRGRRGAEHRQRRAAEQEEARKRAAEEMAVTEPEVRPPSEHSSAEKKHCQVSVSATTSSDVTPKTNPRASSGSNPRSDHGAHAAKPPAPMATPSPSSSTGSRELPASAEGRQEHHALPPQTPADDDDGGGRAAVANRPVRREPSPTEPRHPCVVQYSTCHYGSRCDLRNKPGNLCIHYYRGRCVYGDGCKLRHEAAANPERVQQTLQRKADRLRAEALKSQTHPCMTQLPNCRFGYRCRYLDLPASVCVNYCMGRCKLPAGECPYEHRDNVARPAELPSRRPNRKPRK